MTIRKEQLAENVTLYLGDSRTILPTIGKVDAMIVDAPYGIEDLVGGYGRTQLSTGVRGDKMDARRVNDRRIANDSNLKVVGEVFALARKQMNKSAWVAAFYSCRITPTFFKMMEAAGYKDEEYFGEVVWDKRAPGLGTQIRYQHESVAFFKTGKPPDLTDAMSVISFAALKGAGRAEGSGHPHEKPMQVMLNIVGMVPAKTILDPFAGTFSTGAAAVKLKRGFVGIELDPKYFEIGIKKVQAALNQPEEFWND